MQEAITDFDGIFEFVRLIVEQAEEFNTPMWQALQEWKNTNKDVTALEIAHWVIEYIDKGEPAWIELRIRAEDFRKLVTLIKQAKEQQELVGGFRNE